MGIRNRASRKGKAKECMEREGKQIRRTRGKNWTEAETIRLLNTLDCIKKETGKEILNFREAQWQMVLKLFIKRMPSVSNQRDWNISHLRNRLTVLKRDIKKFRELASKSGWEWDFKLNVPKGSVSNTWDRLTAEDQNIPTPPKEPFNQDDVCVSINENESVVGNFAQANSSGGRGVKNSERASQISGSCKRRTCGDENKMIIELKEGIDEMLRITKKFDVTLDRILEFEVEKNQREREIYMRDKLTSFKLSYTNYHHMLDVLTDPAEMDFFLRGKSAAIHKWFEDKIPGHTQGSSTNLL